MLWVAVEETDTYAVYDTTGFHDWDEDLYCDDDCDDDWDWKWYEEWYKKWL